MSATEQSINVLIGALGGEGGGVMADWLMDAASAAGFPAQATSIPGVAQRTGATTYYLEIYPATREVLAGREPVLALTPTPANVDVVIASELVEAARAMQNGYVTPERTTLIASTHRIYATAEKVPGGDGRADSSRIIEAARALAKAPVLFDMQRLAEENGTVINAVLFGALAGSGALPIPRDACEQAIRNAGRGADASLRGFAAGHDVAKGIRPAPVGLAPARRATSLEEVLDLGVARLTDYQGKAYAQLFLERMKPFLEGDGRLATAVGRHLAVWMSYEDVIRVADLKTRASRFERVRREVGAKDGEPVVIVDYLKPGLEEFASILPAALGRRLVAWAERKGQVGAFHVGMHIKTSTLLGFLLVRMLAWLKPWRPRSYRYGEEQRLIERWLALIRDAAPRDTALALEIAECARLIKGYGETHRRGKTAFLAILDASMENAGAIRATREAALADPEGMHQRSALGRSLPAPIEHRVH